MGEAEPGQGNQTGPQGDPLRGIDRLLSCGIQEDSAPSPSRHPPTCGQAGAVLSSDAAQIPAAAPESGAQPLPVLPAWACSHLYTSAPWVIFGLTCSSGLEGERAECMQMNKQINAKAGLCPQLS